MMIFVRRSISALATLAVVACTSSSVMPPDSAARSPLAPVPSTVVATGSPVASVATPRRTAPAASSSPAAPSSATASPSGWLEWERVDLPTGFVPLGSGPAGFVGFGNPDCLELDVYCREVHPYFSPNSKQWHEAADEDIFHDAHVSAIIGYQGGFLATGATYSMPTHRSERVVAAAWTSADGRSWAKAAVRQADAGWTVTVCEGAGLFVGGIDDVAAVGDVLVGLGRYIGRGRCIPSSIETMLWRSTNGTQWERGQVPRGFRLRTASPLVGGRQFVLADGDRMWVSADGQTWTAVALPVPEGSFVYPAVPHSSGYLAYAYDEQERWHALDSGDGVTWSAVALPPTEGINFYSVVAVGGIYLALYTTSSPPDATGDTGTTYGIVTSSDGVHWSGPHTGPFEGWTLDTFVVGDRSVLVYGRLEYGGDPAIWVANIDGAGE